MVSKRGHITVISGTNPVGLPREKITANGTTLFSITIKFIFVLQSHINNQNVIHYVILANKNKLFEKKA